jgi:hypothetical protein
MRAGVRDTARVLAELPRATGCREVVGADHAVEDRASEAVHARLDLDEDEAVGPACGVVADLDAVHQSSSM